MAKIKIDLYDIELSNSELLSLIRDKLILPGDGMSIINGKFYEDVVIDRDGNTKLYPRNTTAPKKMIKHDKLYKKLYEVLIDGK